MDTAAADGSPTVGEKRKADGEAGEGAGEGGEGEGGAKPPPKKKKKKKPKPGAANKPKPGDHEEDIAAEVEASCVIKATPVPVVFNGLTATFAAGCVSGEVEFAIRLPDPPPEPEPEPEPEPVPVPEPEPPGDADGPTQAAQSGGTPPTPPTTTTTTNKDKAETERKPPGPQFEYLTLEQFFIRAGASAADVAACVASWRETIRYGGDDAPADTPIGGWLQRRGATWGKASVGYQLEILNPDAARSGGSSASMEKQGEPAGGSARLSTLTSPPASTRFPSSTGPSRGATFFCRRCDGSRPSTSPSAPSPSPPRGRRDDDGVAAASRRLRRHARDAPPGWKKRRGARSIRRAPRRVHAGGHGRVYRPGDGV